MINQDNLQSYIKWANIVGIFTIIMGVLAALGGLFAFIVGAAPGVLMIIAGVKLLNAKKAASELLGIEDPQVFNDRLNSLFIESTGFLKFQGIYYIVSLILGIIGIIVSIVFSAVLINNIPMY
ncbi:MAG: hypothetical protein K0R84_2584 [Clostridia bacterium]|jgi:hypothetical protein|nr:hypothetical protein [Clostridia bacterium]